VRAALASKGVRVKDVAVAGDASYHRVQRKGAVGFPCVVVGVVEPHQFFEKLLFSQRGRALRSV
jgi:hypothetical protein